MTITHKIIQRPWGIECRFCCQREGLDDINDSIMLNREDEDPTALITAKIEHLDATQEASAIVQQEPTSSILNTIEDSKESLKWMAVDAIRAGQSLNDFSTSLQWQDAAVVNSLVHAYAQQAYKDGFVPFAAQSKEECWAVLSGIVLAMTNEQLRGIL